VAYQHHPLKYIPLKDKELVYRMLPAPMEHYGSTDGELTDGFGLANRDSSAHNVLVDDNLNIVGPVDLDWATAAPIEAVARTLLAIGVNPTIPGLSTSLEEEFGQISPLLLDCQDCLRKAHQGDPQITNPTIGTRPAAGAGSSGCLIRTGMMDHFEWQGLHTTNTDV
jgi:hypothetical protein